MLWIGGKNCSEDVGFWCVEFVVTMGWPLRMRLDEYNAELFGPGGQPLLHGQSGASGSSGQQQQQDPLHGQSGASGSSGQQQQDLLHGQSGASDASGGQQQQDLLHGQSGASDASGGQQQQQQQQYDGQSGATDSSGQQQQQHGALASSSGQKRAHTGSGMHETVPTPQTLEHLGCQKPIVVTKWSLFQMTQSNIILNKKQTNQKQQAITKNRNQEQTLNQH